MRDEERYRLDQSSEYKEVEISPWFILITLILALISIGIALH